MKKYSDRDKRPRVYGQKVCVCGGGGAGEACLNSKKAAMSGVEKVWEAEGRRCWASIF